MTLNPGVDRTLSVSRIAFDEVLRATSVRRDCDGKGFNAFRALRALGVQSLAIGFFGGATGETLARHLASLEVATGLVPIAEETRTNTVVVEAGLKRHIKVNEAGPTVTREECAAFEHRAREGSNRATSGCSRVACHPACQPTSMPA